MSSRYPDPLACVCGTDCAWDLTLYDAAGDPFACAPSDGLSCVVTEGERAATLCVPVASWTEATAGQLRLAVAASSTAAIEPGVYPLDLAITTVSGVSYPGFLGWLQLDAPAAGVNTPGPVYCAVQDLRDFGGGDFLDQLRRESGFSNFAGERARARAWLDELILRRYRPWDRRRYGSGAASFPTADGPDPTLSGYLADDKLLVTSAVKEVTAYKALELVCRAKVPLDNGDVYARRAGYFHALAESRLLTMSALIDTDGDGLQDLVIPLGLFSIR